MKRKKLFIAVWCLALMYSCVKPSEDTIVTVSIGCKYVESGSINRSSIVPNISEALESIMPTSLHLTIGNETSVHSCISGGSVTLPYGHYSVTGESVQEKTYITDDCWASTNPLVTVNDAIDVVSGVNEYNVNASIKSFVIAWNNAIVESVVVDWSAQALPCVKCGDTSVCCITGDVESLTIVLRTWISETWQSRTYTLTTDPAGEGIRCENGRWYALSPVYVPSEEGVIGVQLEGWTEGGNYF